MTDRTPEVPCLPRPRPPPYEPIRFQPRHKIPLDPKIVVVAQFLAAVDLVATPCNSHAFAVAPIANKVRSVIVKYRYTAHFHIGGFATVRFDWQTSGGRKCDIVQGVMTTVLFSHAADSPIQRLPSSSIIPRTAPAMKLRSSYPDLGEALRTTAIKSLCSSGNAALQPLA